MTVASGLGDEAVTVTSSVLVASCMVVFTSANNENFKGTDGPYIVGLTTTSFDPDTGEMRDADIQFNDLSNVFQLSLTQATGTPSHTAHA